MVVEGLRSCLLCSLSKALVKRCCASRMASASSVGCNGAPGAKVSSCSSSSRFLSSACVTPMTCRFGL